MDTGKGVEYKGSGESKISDALKQRAVAFNHQIKELLKEKYFRQQINENKNKIKVSLKYEDIDSALEGLNNLLVDFGFVKLKNVNGRRIKLANKIRLTQLSTGKLTKIQCRPFKNEMTIVLETAFEEVERLRMVNGVKTKQKIREKTVKISIKLAHEETDELIILENILWQGSEDGLHKKKKGDISEEGAFDKVSVKKW